MPYVPDPTETTDWMFDRIEELTGLSREEYQAAYWKEYARQLEAQRRVPWGLVIGSAAAIGLVGYAMREKK